MFAEVSALWEVLSQQAVGVFVRAALPRALRVAEVDGQASVDAQPCVLSHLCSLVPCQRPAELLGQGRDRRSDRVPDGFGTVSSQRWTVLGPGLVVFIKAGEVGQRREPGGPLDQRSDRRTAQPQDQVAFLVPGNGAVVCLGRPLAEHDLGVNERLAPSAGTCSRHP